MPKISVIIPIYNAQDYLERCLDSVVNQTLKDIEIILIDDCSTDNSRLIIEDYAKNDSRVKPIYHEVNGGESKARNSGLANAQGEFLAFVDNDDAIELDFCEKLYSKAIEENADIAKAVAKVYNYDSTLHYIENQNEEISQYNSKFFFKYCWWTAIYKRELIENNNINFLEGYKLGGDALFLNQALIKANKLALVNDTYYHYYRREDSGDSKVLTPEKVMSVLYIENLMLDNVLNSDYINTDKIGTASLMNWCLTTCIHYAHRRKTVENLKFCVQELVNMYSKVKDYADEKLLFKYIEIGIHKYIKKMDADSIFKYYYENNSYKQRMFAQLRALHNAKRRKGNE